MKAWLVAAAVGLAAVLGWGGAARGEELKVFSYEPTVEFYKDFNAKFAAHEKAAGKDVKVAISHGPSGKQAQAIVNGAPVDVAALSVDFDIDKIAEKGLLKKEWRKEFGNGSVPYYSAVVFLVRKGNPKGIKDWEDLARDDVTKLAPDPKTGGGARWIYLSTWAHALRKGGDEAAARAFTAKVYDKKTAILDPAMRGSTTNFIKNQTGGVLFGWENEILQIVNDPEVKNDYLLVVPSDSITIEVPIAIVEENVKKHGTAAVAKDFVDYLYSDEGQEIVAKFYNRPSNEKIAGKYKDRFAAVKLFKFKDHFDNWPNVMKKHFEAGGELSQIRGK